MSGNMLVWPVDLLSSMELHKLLAKVLIMIAFHSMGEIVLYSTLEEFCFTFCCRLRMNLAYPTSFQLLSGPKKFVLK